ncbi:hypothetical protein F4779DRAFT_581522 [Xylariaceae sp. FL0662B]|nr:hypothetical protein F4779DRAFT_581522 [Xylariaceae sp. FL0662B]
MSLQEQSFSSNNPFRRKLGNSPHPISSESPASAPPDPVPPRPRPPFTTFKSALHEDENRQDDETTSTPPKPKKIVKKVRVQSPPPSSPEDSLSGSRFPPLSDGDDDDEDSYRSDSTDHEDAIADPFNATSLASEEDEDIISAPPLSKPPPPNPFSKTSHHVEQAGQVQDANALAAGAAARGTLDVDSFRRLLLTGRTNMPGQSPASVSGSVGTPGGSTTRAQIPVHDGSSNTDMNSTSRQSTFDAIQETPRTSHDISEPEDPEERKGALPSTALSTVQSASSRKKPPPPSSRHGKLIKIELGAGADRRTPTKDSTHPMSVDASFPAIAPPRRSNSQSATPLQRIPSASDVNKPLPIPPARPSTEETESPFDHEAIGKVPEAFANIQANPRPPTPPTVTRSRSESHSSTQSRKPAAPPPRRHGRTDSRAPSTNAANADEDAPRSSIESSRSPAESVRAGVSSNNNVNAPAPPPPRRPTHARQTSFYTNPSLSNFGSTQATSPGVNENERSPVGMGFSSVSNGARAENVGGLATVTTSKDGLPKLSPPPPPPARQATTRRPPSVRSVDSGTGIGAARRVSREKEGGVTATPPPPPPPRQRVSSRASTESSAPGVEATSNVAPTPTPAVGGGEAHRPQEGQTGAEILADINALQREVDALMGRYGNTGGS